MDRDSASLFSSASCCTMVLLHAFKEVFRNSDSGSVCVMLVVLCLTELLGNLVAAPEEECVCDAEAGVQDCGTETC